MLEDASARVIYRGSRHAVLRVGRPDGGSVIVKTPLGAGAAAADSGRLLEREYQLLRSLDVRGIGQALALEERAGMPALILVDAGPHDLSQWQRRRPVPIGLFFKLALELAETVGRLHQRGIIHRDVSPSNVVVSLDERLTLVDFDAAAALEAAVGLAPRREGSLRYLSPEETGRLDRLVDHRTDLYGLGATYYEMLTGTPLFSAVDPVDLVHAQLARAPVPPERINPRVPAALSGILLRLLAKMPEARYASVEHLLHDLRAVRVAADADAGAGMAEPRAVGRHRSEEAGAVFSSIQGRQQELAQLGAAWARAAAGGQETVDVVGEAGIGKSTLARQLIPAVAERNGRFVHAKFAMRQGQGPHAALLDALRELFRDLQQSRSDGVAWGQRIAGQLGDDLGALLQVLPDLQRLFHIERRGPPSPRAERGFAPAFVGLIRALAEPEHPLLFCLDDLQWAGTESLRLVESLLASSIPHLMLLCTRRPDGQPPSGLAASGVQQLRLSGLDAGAVTALTADLLSCDPPRAAELADLLWRKTGGNPLLCRRLLASLQSSRLLVYDTEGRGWTWDLTKIAALEVTDGVADLMVRSLGRLPPGAREALALVACLGHQARLSTLAAARHEPESATAAALEPAVREGHLLLLWRGQAPDGPRPVYQFAHDRVLEAAYSLLPEPERLRLHRVLGRQLLREARLSASGSEPDFGEAIFGIVDQLNLGPCSPEESLELAALNQTAARQARAAFAFTAELAYLQKGLALLPADAWTNDRPLTLALHQEAMESAVANGQSALADQLFQATLARASSLLEKAGLHERRAAAATAREDHAQAAAISTQALALFGLEPPANAGSALDEIIADNERCLAGRTIEQVLEAPRMTSAEHLCCLKLLCRQQIAFYLTRNELSAPTLARIVNLTLRHGIAAPACQALVSYGLLLLRRTGDARLAYRWGRLGVGLSSTFDDPSEECRALAIFHTAVAGWTEPMAQQLPGLRRVLRLGMDCGDTLFGASAAVTAVMTLYHLGRPLPEVLSELDGARVLTRKGNLRLAEETLLALRKVILRLQNDPDGEGPCVEQGDRALASCPHLVIRLAGAYLLGDLEEARQLATRAEALVPSFTRTVQPVELNFYGSLTFARCCQREGLASADRQQMLAKLEANQQELGRWAESCPENFRHKHLLVAAELAAATGRPLEAVELYDQALEAAARVGFLQDEALAAELCARFHRAHGRKRFARRYLEAALEGYARWGAEARTRVLESELCDLQGDRHWPLLGGAGVARPSSGTDGVDLMSLARAGEAIAGEIARDRLSARLMEICLAMGGAERGALLTLERGELELWASGAVGAPPDVRPRPLDDSAELPLQAIERVRRTGEPLVVGDATQEPEMGGDPWLTARAVRSLLALPIVRQGRLRGVLYLEHARASRTFTPERVRLLQLLSGQIAVALENSQLFERLAAEVEERRRAEASVRLLADAGAAMGESLNYQDTLEKVVQLAVPWLADWCLVDLLDERGQMRRMAAAHREPQLTERLSELRTDGDRWISPALSQEVLQAGKAVLVPEVTNAVLEQYISDPRVRDVARELGVTSGISVPLMAHGRCLGAMTFSSTRADRRYAETDLMLAEELARRAALAIENARLYAEAREAIRLREEFLAVASHELNTPITSLRLVIDSLNENLFQDASREETERALAILGRQSRRLSTLVHDLLDVTQLQSGRLVLRLEDGDLAAIVRQAAEAFQPESLRQRCTLEVRADQSIPGRWDRGRIEQIVTNLLSNAVKFGSGKPITVAAEAMGASRARLVIEDAGIGIPPDRLAHVFDRFERAVPPTHYGGLGLGLYIVREVARALGGAVAVESAMGKGSRFTVELPVVPSPPLAAT